jgi:hypothetical protein
MAEAVPAIAAVSSIASVGLNVFGAEAKGQSQAAADRVQAQGIAAGDEFRAAELDRAAQYGELKATQTGAQLTRNLNITLGNIDAIRSAAHDDPTSPTGAAIRDYAEATGTEQKGIEVSSLEAQAKQSEADAAYLRYAGHQALLSGDLGATSALLSGNLTAGADILKGIGGGLNNLGGGSTDLSQVLSGGSPLGQGGIGHA